MTDLNLLLDTPRFMALFVVVLECALIAFALAQPQNRIRNGFILSTIFNACYLLGGAMSGAIIRTQVTRTDYLKSPSDVECRPGVECKVECTPVDSLPICHQDTLDVSLIGQSCLDECLQINDFQILLSAENWMRFCFVFVYLLLSYRKAYIF